MTTAHYGNFLRASAEGHRPSSVKSPKFDKKVDQEQSQYNIGFNSTTFKKNILYIDTVM